MKSIVSLWLLVLVLGEVGAVPAWYTSERQQFLDKERSESTGAKLTLTSKEKIVNKILMSAKKSEINGAIYNSATFLPSLHFFKALPLMNQSRVFKIIEKMPKGAALHLHLGATTSIEWVVKNVTYRPNCYMCVVGGTIWSTGFHTAKPQDKDCTWVDISQMRANSPDVQEFDQSILRNLTLNVDNPDLIYPDINSIWRPFSHYFRIMGGLLAFRPVYEDYLYQTLKEFNQDNVQYIELRYGSTHPYELNGTVHDHSWLLGMFRRVVNQFKHDYPGFSGAKFIYGRSKRTPLPYVLQAIKASVNELKAYHDIFLGFDLVSQEDTTPEILHFINSLMYPFSHHTPVPFYFHAGETDWLDIHDNNLLDAILMNTTRIGHGYAIPKHPEVMRIVKDNQIPIEVNPISNQVLKLVADLRNHPASVLLAQDFPICISSDDPAVWEALPLSHDFYMAFMALAGADDDLRFLKQLAINSINFSGMSPSEKTAALQLWQTKWQQFLTYVIRTYYPNHAHIIG